MRFELSDKFNILQSEYLKSGEERIFINKNELLGFLTYLKNVPECDYDMLKSISCAQFDNEFEISYYLFSFYNKDSLIVTTKVQADEAYVDSVVSVYPSANWDEREIFDLFGVKFNNHPNLKRIIMPDSWIGHPLLKDYQNEDKRLRWNYE